MFPKVSELRQQGTAKLNEAEKIFTDLVAANAEPTAEQEQRHDALLNEAQALFDKAKKQEAREQQLNILQEQADAAGNRHGGNLPHNDPKNTRNGTLGYSLLKALRESDPSNKNVRLSGIELETHQELLKRRSEGGHKVEGVLTPWDLEIDTRMAGAYANAKGLERRDLTTSTGAGAVITTTLTTMIELLRVATLMNRLGAKTLSDMNGNFNIPRQSGAGTGYWINPESATITASNQTIDNVAYSPKSLGAQTVYSRSFLNQTSVDAEMFVREDQTLVLAIALDNAGFSGSGSGAIPTGIAIDSNVNIVAIGANGGPPTWALVANLEKQVEIQNALNGTLAYVTSPQGRYKLKTTVKDSNTAAKYLWNEDNNMVNGYPAFSSNQIAANLTKGSGTNLTNLIFGDFTQALYALWGGTDRIINPFTYANKGAVEVTSLQDADFHVRHPKSFAVIKDLDPA